LLALAVILATKSQAFGLPGVSESAVHIELECPALSADAEQRAAFEARALVELAVRRRASGVLGLRCDDALAILTWESPAGRTETRVPVSADRKLFVDALIAALWALHVRPQPAEPSADVVVRDSVADLRFGLSLGGHAELWPRSPNVFPGVRLGLTLRSERWSATAFGMYAAALERVEGIEITTVAGGVAFEARPFPMGLEFGVGIRAATFIARAPSGVEPREDATLTVAAFTRARFVHEWSRVWIGLGPELLAYAVRPRVLIDDEQVLAGSWVVGGFGVDLGWIL
jgi:hypothetical protein